ncbi:Proprotein convertase subtilisin/kexin type 7 [Trichoplax sp. H2]|nr:Proprotein convertase subtilisin/kexin type 7 [Trichoplax sp. H2]|eukprot:RDD47637.1 Proprotein convertase subtilisin/kexin type 7 [Trichoplax sp. H2]
MLLLRQIVVLVLLSSWPIASLSKESNIQWWAVQLKEDSNRIKATSVEYLDKVAIDIARQYSLKLYGRIGELANYYLYYSSVDSHAGHSVLQLNQKLQNHPFIQWHQLQENLVRHKRQVESPINFPDPFYPDQWHLHNLRDPNHDINVTNVWNHNITGKDVVVAIIDDGVQWKNEDLVDNYEPKGSWDVIDNDDDPVPAFAYPQTNYHGTRCAGVASAVTNQYCGVGVAYGSKFSAIRLLDTTTTDAKESAAFSTKSQTNDIYSCSWGPLDDGKTVDGPRELTKKAILAGVTNGRKKLGNIFVVAAGNGGTLDDCNYDGFANSVYTLTIGAVTENLSPTPYSEPCSAMHAVAFGGSSGSASITTTDWKSDRNSGCTRSFTGTSAAAPMAAGIVALMLSTNFCLTWRDVQYIIALSSVKIRANDNRWMTNTAGFHHHPLFGFGLISAWNAVKLAATWENLPPSQQWQSDNYIGDSGRVLINNTHTSSVNVNFTGLVYTLEHVVVSVHLEHSFRGNIEIYIRCPSGIEAKLASSRTTDNSREGFNNWEFSTVRCWGESPYGLWELRIVDTGSRKDGVLKSWFLRLFGSTMLTSDVARKIRIAQEVSTSDSLQFNSECPLNPRNVTDGAETSIYQGNPLNLMCIVVSYLLSRFVADSYY